MAIHADPGPGYPEPVAQPTADREEEPPARPVNAARLHRFRKVARPVGLPVKAAFLSFSRIRLRWIYIKEGIDGIQAELRRMRANHARVLRAFGARIAPDSSIVGPVCLANSDVDFSNLEVATKAHLGSEVFLDLAAPIRIEEGATLSMRSVIITHLDVGRGPLKQKRPRQLGAVTIREGAFIGAGATILHGVTIGREAVIAAGVVISKDVADGEVIHRPGQPNESPSTGP